VEKLINCDIAIDIEMIENISGGNQQFEILCATKTGGKYKLVFDFVWDMRYAIENASIDRFFHFRKHTPKETVASTIYIVQDSEYIKYFENQVSGARPIDGLVHYLLCDGIDSTIDVLTTEAPTLVEV